MSETNLSVLVKEVGEALLLDNSNHDKEAYKKYISCIYKIATNLMLAMKQAGGDVVVDSKTSKQVKLVQQCVERVSALLEKMNSLKTRSAVMLSPSATSFSDRSIPSANNQQMESFSVASPVNRQISDLQMSITSSSSVHSSTHTQLPTPAVQPDQSSQFSSFVPSLISETNPHAYSAYKSRALTPMEIAKRQNQSLMMAYKARMKRLNRSDFSAFNYSLTIQRKMAENIAIAQAQEEELARKMQARNARLEEEATKRFATPLGMSKEEQEQRQIYKRILEYENEAKWLKNWRSKLESNPEDPILINQLVQEILRCSDHPFTELLHKYQFNIYKKLYTLVTNKHHEIDMIKVPMPESAWPSKDDVADILREGFHLPSSPVNETYESKIRKGDIDESNKNLPDGSENFRDKKILINESLSSSVEERGKKTFTSSDDDKNGMPIAEDTDLRRRRTETWDDPLCVRSKSNSSLKTVQDESCISVDKEDGLTGSTHEDNASSSKEDLVDDERQDSVPKQSAVSLSDSNEDRGLFTDETKRLGTKTEDSSKNAVSEKNSVVSIKVSQQETSKDVGENNETFHEAASGRTRPDTLLMVDKGKELESQLSWERRQAQILMRQVTKDYSSYKLGESDYDENNLDYLFDDGDDDDDDDELYSWFNNNNSIKLSHQSSSSSKTATSQALESTESPVQSQSLSLDRSVSETPAPVRPISENDHISQFQSLPVTLNQDSRALEDKEFERLSHDAYKRHLKSISEDIHRFLEKLLVMMTIAYEPLDTPVGKDQCAVSLEEPFFKPIWKTLLRLFRVVNHKQELVLACVMTRYADATLEDFKVSKKLWLAGTDSSTQPYHHAITELANVKEHYTMLNKLECVVKVCRLICQCVDDYYKTEDGHGHQTGKKAPSIGADDLLPILCYVVVKSAVPQLGTECLAMTEFIHEGYMMGEEGYCLTTLRTALNYVVTMFQSVTRSS